MGRYQKVFWFMPILLLAILLPGVAVWSFFGWVGGLVAAATMGAVTSYIGQALFEVFPHPRRLIQLFRDYFHKPASGSHFTILICNLAEDRDTRQTGHVASALRGQDGIEIIRSPKILEIDPLGLQSTAETNALAEGQNLLREYNADLLIWGEVAVEDKVLRLGFLRRDSSGQLIQRPYGLENAVLPQDFGDDFNNHLVATAVANLSPKSDTDSQQLAKLLRPAADKLAILVSKPPRGLTPFQKASLSQAQSYARAVIGSSEGDEQKMLSAAQGYIDLLDVWTQDKTPERWAITQSNLGNIYCMLGDKSVGSAYFGKSRKAYFNALTIFTRRDYPLEWAMLQNNIGNALRLHGEREKGITIFLEAEKCCRSAVEEYKHQGRLLQTAIAQINLGTVLINLGEREQNKARLKEGLEVLTAAKLAITNKENFESWVNIECGIAIATFFLGSLGEKIGLQQKAVQMGRKILWSYPPDGRVGQKTALQITMGNLLAQLARARLVKSETLFAQSGIREKPTKTKIANIANPRKLYLALAAYWNTTKATRLLQEAVEVCQETAAVLREQNSEYELAIVQNHLGMALLLMGKFEAGTVLLEQAVAAHAEAEATITKSEDPTLWIQTQFNKGNALMELADREASSARFIEAIDVFQNVLKELSPQDDFEKCTYARWQIGKMLLALGCYESSVAKLNHAVDFLRETVDAYTILGSEREIAQSSADLERAERELANRM